MLVNLWMVKNSESGALVNKMPKWKYDVYPQVTSQIRSYGFTDEENQEVDEILNRIISDPLGAGSKKLRKSQVSYSTRYERHLGFDEYRVPIIEHYRFIYKVYPKRRTIIVTDFKDRETAYLNIRGRLDWESLKAIMDDVESQNQLANRQIHPNG